MEHNKLRRRTGRFLSFSYGWLFAGDIMPSQTLEALEPRRLLAGGSKIFTIEGGNTSTDVLEVELDTDGMHWTINNGSEHFAPYSRRLRQINIKAGLTHDNYPNEHTQGEHTVNVNVRSNRARVHVFGTDQSVNHIKVDIFAKNVEVTLHGGNKSLNELEGDVHAKNGAVTIIGGNFSTNMITFGGGTNTVFGGDSSRNSFFQTVIKSQGYVRGGNSSSNIFYAPNGTFPRKYKLRNGVQVSQA